MKRIDLHIHTLPSNIDERFSFDESVLVNHVKANGLAGIAVTNHNLFDRGNYERTVELFPGVAVLPGIEVSVRSYHVLVIADPADIDDFENRCQEVPDIGKDEDGITLTEFRRLFCDMGWFVIPHYRKKPSIDAGDLEVLENNVTALEISSQKKWEREFKDSRVHHPVVMFSDMRCFEGRGHVTGKYTYADVDQVSFGSLKLAFHDKSKFCITEKRGAFELAPNLYASTGLNVVIGGRSTGKSYLLNGIYESCDPSDVIYVRQFSIVKDADEDSFKRVLEKESQAIRDSYYAPMHAVAKAMSELPPAMHAIKQLKDYIDSLKDYAESLSREDEYSKCPIYSCGKLPSVSFTAELKVAKAIIALLEKNPLSVDIEKEIGTEVLKKLLKKAIAQYRAKKIKQECINRANNIVQAIKLQLAYKSSRPECPVSPFMEVARRQGFVSRFSRLRERTREEAIIKEESVGRFTRIAMRRQYEDAKKLKKAIGTSTNLGGILQKSGRDFTEELLKAKGATDLAKSLFRVDVDLKNDKGQDVSGGQRAEYLFLKALKDAAAHDMVLIDEPESSFDNLYLNRLITLQLREIATRSTVFIATHNNVLGVSIEPSGIIYTSGSEDGSHDVFTGSMTDDYLTNASGEKVSRSEKLIELMEAGDSAYQGRRPYYGLDE